MDILQLFIGFGMHLSPHLRAPHYSIRYIRHYFPQVSSSSWKIKLRKNPFQKLILILNFAWSNYSPIQALYDIYNFRWWETIIIMNSKVEIPSDTPLPTCIREWVAYLSMLSKVPSAFEIWHVHWGTSSNSQMHLMSSMPFGLRTTTHNLLATTFHSIWGVEICK